MDGRMDGWTDGLMDGWMDGWNLNTRVCEKKSFLFWWTGKEKKMPDGSQELHGCCLLSPLIFVFLSFQRLISRLWIVLVYFFKFSVHPFLVTSIFEPGPTWSAERALFRSTQIYGRAQAITPGSADQNSDIALSSAFILPVLLSSHSLSPCCNTDCLCKAAVCKNYKNQ